MASCFYIRKDSSGKYRWIYVGTEGNQIAAATESFESYELCAASVREMKASISAPVLRQD